MDADNLVGVVQIENILIFAESYDVALDITFPKGLLTPPKKECLEVTSFRAVCFLCRERPVIIGEKGGIEVNSRQTQVMLAVLLQILISPTGDNNGWSKFKI